MSCPMHGRDPDTGLWLQKDEAWNAQWSALVVVAQGVRVTEAELVLGLGGAAKLLTLSVGDLCAVEPKLRRTPSSAEVAMARQVHQSLRGCKTLTALQTAWTRCQRALKGAPLHARILANRRKEQRKAKLLPAPEPETAPSETAPAQQALETTTCLHCNATVYRAQTFGTDWISLDAPFVGEPVEPDSTEGTDVYVASSLWPNMVKERGRYIPNHDIEGGELVYPRHRCRRTAVTRGA